jgi:hypothetical protein
VRRIGHRGGKSEGPVYADVACVGQRFVLAAIRGERTGSFLRGIIAKPTLYLSKTDAPINDFDHDVASSRRHEFRRKFTFFPPVPQLDLAVLKFFERVGHDWHIAKLSWTNLPDLALNFGEY